MSQPSLGIRAQVLRWKQLRPSAKTFLHDEGQSIVEYAIALGIILVLSIGVLRLFETNAFQILLQIAKSIG